MAIALLFAAALAWWLHRRGELLPNLARYAGTGAAGLIAIRLLTAGKPLMAIVAAGVAYAWWLARKPALTTPETSARSLLGLAEDADADAIQAAWRARMAQAHPDAGGSDDAARAVTAARDLLLARKRP